MLALRKKLFAGYGNRKLPLGGYALIDLIYFTWLGGGLTLASRRGKSLPEHVSFQDIVLYGMATHKMSVILTKEWATAPIRAPFTRYRGVEKSGELDEVSRGHGFREAVGDLLTCPYCAGVWISTGFMMMSLASPRASRLIASVFAAVTVSDFLNSAYEKV